jgi:hypothetical protein
MKRLLFLFIAVAVMLTFLSGCYSRINADFGTSFKLAKYNQIYNLDAEKNLEPVYGLDGIAVHNAMDKYHAGFKEKEPATNYTFSIGGTGTGN